MRIKLDTEKDKSEEFEIKRKELENSFKDELIKIKLR